MGIIDSYLIPIDVALGGLALFLKTGALIFLVGGLLLGIFFFIFLGEYRL